MKIVKDKNTSKIFATILIIILVIAVITISVQFAIILNKKNKLSKLQSAYKDTIKSIEEYDETLDYINYQNGEYSEDFLSAYAREVLGWGKANRTYYTSK